MADHPSRDAEPRPPAMVVSAACGAVGVVLFLLGAVVGTNVLFFAGLAAGIASLAVALYWRSELIAAWRAQQARPPR